jgi:membrane protein implicated in regulation of membrane protease activity
MLQDPLFWLIALACLAVVFVLALGIGGFAIGGKDRGKKSNKLMQWRIGLQFVAVVLIVIFVWLRGG